MRLRWLMCLSCLLLLAACQSEDAEQVQISCVQGSPGHRTCSEYFGFDDDALARMAANCRGEYGRVVSQCDLSENWVGTCVSRVVPDEPRRARHHHLVHPDRASEYPVSTLIRSCQTSQGTWQPPPAM